MKRLTKITSIIILSGVLFCSCHSYSVSVGTGGNNELVTKKTNQYFVAGLVKGKISNSKKLSEGLENYTVKTEQTFLNGLWAVLTLGIYTPTKTTITK